MIVGALECLEITLGSIAHGTCHGLTMSTAHKTGLKSQNFAKRSRFWSVLRQIGFTDQMEYFIFKMILMYFWQHHSLHKL